MESATKQIAGYEVKNPREVLWYLLWHPGLIKTVLDAPAEIKKVFGDAQITLEVHRDYECPRWKILLATILASDDVSDAIALLDKLGEDWWHDNLSSKMAIDLEFIDTTVKQVEVKGRAIAIETRQPLIIDGECHE